MPVKNARAATTRQPARRDVDADAEMALKWLQAKSTARDRANLARFGINARNAFGVSMANIQALAKKLGRSHELVLEIALFVMRQSEWRRSSPPHLTLLRDGLARTR